MWHFVHKLIAINPCMQGEGYAISLLTYEKFIGHFGPPTTLICSVDRDQLESDSTANTDRIRRPKCEWPNNKLPFNDVKNTREEDIGPGKIRHHRHPVYPFNGAWCGGAVFRERVCMSWRLKRDFHCDRGLLSSSHGSMSQRLVECKIRSVFCTMKIKL